MIENSFFYGLFQKIVDWFLIVLNKSFLYNMFITQENALVCTENSKIYKFFNSIRMFFVNLLRTLKFDKLFQNSIFKLHFFWCVLPIVISPFAPTMVVILLCAAGYASLLLKMLTEKSFTLKYFNINKCIYIYAFIYLSAIITSVEFSSSLYGGVVTICFILFTIITINSVRTKDQLRIVLFLLSAGGVGVSLYGFYQFLFPGNFGGSWVDASLFSGMFRVYSTFANPNVLGEYFLLIIPIAVASCFISKHIVMKIFYFGATSVMLVCLALTYSRGCYIGILCAAAVFAILLDRRFIILGLVCVLIFPIILPDSVLGRFGSITNLSDSSTSYRLNIWRGTIEMLHDYWFTGIGPGEDAYNKVYPLYAYSGIGAPHSHNTFLQVMCDAGFAGLIAFILIIYNFFKQTFVGYLNSKNKTEKILCIGFISSMVGFFSQSIFDYTFYNYRVTALFWFLLGLGIVASNYSKLKEEGLDWLKL